MSILPRFLGTSLRMGCLSKHMPFQLDNRCYPSWYLTLTEATTRNAIGLRTLSILVIWTIWHERNNRIFRGECLTVEHLFDGVRDEAKLWTMAGARALAALVGTPSRE
ncbi:hypothetical protein HU200_045771 [Digitaria exilis]|uniref:Uncharacterized protein n=1 Tax=Digitaria exilis TaxID=1010633 RepID=A0A835AWJ2_9POAL|nr:hypothetical protein HU200_045771 [Digitaria exilis]